MWAMILVKCLIITLKKSLLMLCLLYFVCLLVTSSTCILFVDMQFVDLHFVDMQFVYLRQSSCRHFFWGQILYRIAFCRQNVSRQSILDNKKVMVVDMCDVNKMGKPSCIVNHFCGSFLTVIINPSRLIVFDPRMYMAHSST